MKPNTDGIRETTPRPRAALTREQRADPLRPYYAEVGAHELFTPEEEAQRARDIEETEVACWRALLTHPATADHVADRIAALAGNEAPDMGALRATVSAAASRRSSAATRELERVADATARQMRDVSAHWDLLEAVFAHLRALPNDAAAARALGFRPGSKGYAAWLQRVSSAERAAARARNLFVNANLRLVFHVAHRYRSSGVPMADLVQEGNLGLIRAIDKFDYKRGLRFSTYARWWISHMIGRAVANRSRAVRVPVYLLELRGRIERVAVELERELGRTPTDAEIAEAAGIPEDKVGETRSHCQSFEFSLDDTVGRDEDGASRYDVFSDPADENRSSFELLAAAADRSTVAELLASIPPRERDILEKRFGLDESGREWTLREIAEQQDLSRERIRQLEKRAMKRLRDALESRDYAT